MAHKIIFMRHGHALAFHEAGGNDWQRPLSDIGRKDVVKSAALVKSAGFKPEIILTSPLLRAKQTAELLAKETQANIRVLDALSGELPADKIWQAVEPAINKCQCAAITGHQPYLQELCELFSCTEAGPLKPAEFRVLVFSGPLPKELQPGIAELEPVKQPTKK